MRHLLVVSLTILSLSSFSSDIRTLVGKSNTPKVSNVINPDKSIFGVSLGTTEDEFIKTYGNPTGYVNIDSTTTGMMYGTNVLFFFDSGRLSGVRISHNILDWKIAKDIRTNTPFDNVRWKFSSGLHEDMSKVAVKKILGDKLKSDMRGYRTYFSTNKAEVELDFSHFVDAGEDDSAYRLYGVTVRAK